MVLITPTVFIVYYIRVCIRGRFFSEAAAVFRISYKCFHEISDAR